MIPLTDPRQFIEEPVGHWYVGRVFLVWNASPALAGLIVWGRPAMHDVVEMSLTAGGYRRRSPRCNELIDISRIEAIDAATYAEILNSTGERSRLDEDRPARHAIVRSEGLLGTLAEGFLPLTGAGRSWRVFRDAAAAFEWSGQAQSAALRDEVAGIVERVHGTPAPLRRLREYIEQDLAGATLAGAAAALALSERSLQRQLRRLGTHFREEVCKVRIEVASILLCDPDLKIEAIAREVGFSSHTYFSMLFHRSTGLTPSQYRDRQRRHHAV